MKHRILFLILIVLSITSPVYSQVNPVTVKVIDIVGNPISNVQVSIDGSKNYKTGPSGTFTYTPSKRLVMPLKVVASKSGYKIEEFLLLNDHEVEITMDKVAKVDKNAIMISILDMDKLPFVNSEVLIEGKPYFTNERGIISFNGQVPPKEAFEIPNYDLVDYEYLKKKNKINIKIQPMPVLQQDTLVDSTAIIDELNELKEGNTFNWYKEEFTRLSKEVVDERVSLEEKNNEIRKEIERISARLKSEKDLTQAERKELEGYLDHLINLLEENSIAYKKAEEKTRLLLDKLRLIILAKDSIAYQRQLEAEKAKLDKAKAEEEFKSKVIVFSITTGVLLFIAVIFYFQSRRIARQKKQLEDVNTDLESVKNELVRNVVEVKNQKRLIEEQNEQLDAFVYKASHDIKGPLRSVIGLTQTGLKTIKDPSSLEYFEHILKSTQKLDNLLADLLNLTKFQQATVKKVDLNISTKIKDVLKSFSNWSEFNQMQFNLNFPDNLMFSTDESMFSSIVQNFIENAIKYKDASKPVSYLNITAKKEDGKLLMEFEDNGLGIEPDHVPKIFDMFYKVNQGSVGTGLGLHIVKLNIEKLNGNVHVASAVKKGTTFTVEFNS